MNERIKSFTGGMGIGVIAAAAAVILILKVLTEDSLDWVKIVAPGMAAVLIIGIIRLTRNTKTSESSDSTH